jgi:hypothetical protein
LRLVVVFFRARAGEAVRFARRGLRAAIKPPVSEIQMLSFTLSATRFIFSGSHPIDRLSK